MQTENKTTETKPTEIRKKNRKKKPLRRAQRWGREIPAMVGKLLSLMIAIVVMGLMFSALQGVGAAWLRIALSVLILSGMLLLCMNEGLTKGAADAASSRNYAGLEEKGHKLEAMDDAACYHPLKPVAAGLALFAIPLALSAIVALCAKEYTYTLQDLPAWLTDSYGARGDLLAPLGAYKRETALTALDWMRLMVRLPLMTFINLFPDPMRMSALIDRLSPLMMLSFPALYVLGYLCGPRIQRKREKSNRRAKKVAVKRSQKKSLVEELTGAQGQVHYGHRKEEEKKTRKELV